jgi:hypothetical protein
VQAQPPLLGNTAASSRGFTDSTRPVDIEELKADSVAVGLAQALGLGPLLRGQVLRPVGMLPGLLGQ